MDSITQGGKTGSGTSPILWIIMGVGLLLIGALVVWVVTQPTPTREAPRLENAMREGAEFEELRKKIVVEPNYDFTTENRSLSGNLAMSIWGVVRNFSGRTITGLEVVASVVEKDSGKTVREKSIVVIPTVRPQLENNKTMPINIVIEGFEESDKRDYVKWRIVGLKVQ